MAPWFTNYLWVTFGNGFRYGARWLFVSAAISLAGFAAVVAATPWWRENLPLSIGLLVALAALPAYVATLITQLRPAHAQAAAANSPTRRSPTALPHTPRTPPHPPNN